MGEMRRVTGDRSCWLPGHMLIGRSPSCQLRLQDKRVSGEHARLSFHEGAWKLRDLGSRNGTTVDGQPLAPGQTISLSEGCTVCFGSAGEGWVLSSAAPPVAMAVSADGVTVRAEGGFLALPGDQSPEVCIYQQDSGEWVADKADDLSEVSDLAPLTAGGRQWVLHLPQGLAATWMPKGKRQPRLETLRFRFAVSPDEEHVAIYTQSPAQEARLPSRAHDYMLLTLARARLRDRLAGCSTAEEGWLHVLDLCRMLRIDENKLSVDIYRARKVLGAQGIQGAPGLIERRRTSRQVRLGVEQLAVDTL